MYSTKCKIIIIDKEQSKFEKSAAESKTKERKVLT